MKKNDLIATMMSALGGTFFALPWFFLYVSSNRFSYLASILIPFGFYIFYKIFKGQNRKDLLKIIGMESLLIMILINFLIVPVYSLKISNIEMRFDNFLFIYSFPKFRESLFINAGVGIIIILFGLAILYLFSRRKNK